MNSRVLNRREPQVALLTPSVLSIAPRLIDDAPLLAAAHTHMAALTLLTLVGEGGKLGVGLDLLDRRLRNLVELSRELLRMLSGQASCVRHLFADGHHPGFIRPRAVGFGPIGQIHLNPIRN